MRRRGTLEDEYGIMGLPAMYLDAAVQRASVFVVVAGDGAFLTDPDGSQARRADPALH
jgi:hypothetical protein